MRGQSRSSSPRSGYAGMQKSVKRRSSTACQVCRARKVRCNVIESGPPCLNCRLDDVQCIISASKRRRRTSRRAVESISPPTDHESLNPIECPYHVEYSNSQTCNRKEVCMSYSYSHEPCEASQKLPQEVEDLSTRCLNEGLNGCEDLPLDTQSQSAETAPPRLTGSLSAPSSRNTIKPKASYRSGIAKTSLSPASSLVAEGLPAWVKPLPEQMNPNDAIFLATKGALSVYDKLVCDELLQCFLRWIYPWSPVVNRDYVTRIISGDFDESEKISLLLLQAMMFAGVGFADLAVLRRVGFKSRRDARNQLYNRCKLLYDFDYEDDCLVLIQALVLMTYWHDGSGHQKNIGHWVTVALALARTIGLNHDLDLFDITTTEKHLRKRIWWCLCMRDGIIALSMRHEAKIQPHENRVPSLLMTDFETNEYPTTDSTSHMKQSSAENDHVAMLSIAACSLCTIIGKILKTKYSTVCVRQQRSKTRKNINAGTIIVSMPRMGQDDKTQTKALDAMLSTWLRELPSEIDYKDVRRQDCSSDKLDQRVHCAQLMILYQTAVILLFRPAHLLHSSHSVWFESTEEASFARDQSWGASLQISRISTELESTQHMLTEGVITIAHGAMVQLIEATSPDPTHRHESIDNLAKSLHMLKRFGDVYVEADMAMLYLKSQIAKSGLTAAIYRTSLSMSPQPVPNSGLESRRVNLEVMGYDSAKDIIIAEDSATMKPLENLSSATWSSPMPSGQVLDVDEIFASHDTSSFMLEDYMVIETDNTGYDAITNGDDNLWFHSHLI